MKKLKILVVGIGGVGGYFGGLLAKEYHSSTTVDIYFLARGENLIQIKKHGLKVLENETEFIAKPAIVSDNVEDFGVVDYILLCTKTYDLDETIIQLLPSINDNTVLVPLQNGINNKARISNRLPKNLITEGCVYLISRLTKPGTVLKKGNVDSLFFGVNSLENEKLEALQNIFLQANINSQLSKKISEITWEKFIFLSSIATATTYFDSIIHPILNDKEKCDSLRRLISEVTNLALSKEIKIENPQTERIIEKLSSLPLDATASMHSDFQNLKKNTELESLTGFVVLEGNKNNVNVETFEKMYHSIKKD